MTTISGYVLPLRLRVVSTAMSAVVALVRLFTVGGASNESLTRLPSLLLR